MAENVLTGQTAAKYIADRARQFGLDAAAVLAVAKREGGFAQAVGDSGTSFGPFQLHVGGAFPTQVNGQSTAGWSAEQRKAWANTPAGLDYALMRISAVAHGLTGGAAISNIVTRFERPAAPGPEIRDAVGYYPAIKLGLSRSDYSFAGEGGGGVAGAVAGAAGAVAGAVPGLGPDVTDIAGGVKDAVGSVGDFLGTLADPNFWLRALQILGGAVLAFAGLTLLVRQVALAADLPDPAGVAGAVASRGVA